MKIYLINIMKANITIKTLAFTKRELVQQWVEANQWNLKFMSQYCVILETELIELIGE